MDTWEFSPLGLFPDKVCYRRRGRLVPSHMVASNPRGTGPLELYTRSSSLGPVCESPLPDEGPKVQPCSSPRFPGALGELNPQQSGRNTCRKISINQRNLGVADMNARRILRVCREILSHMIHQFDVGVFLKKSYDTTILLHGN